MASTEIVRGKSVYSVIHFLYEDDVLDVDTAEKIALGILVITELAILGAKLVLLNEIGEMSNPFAGRMGDDEWNSFVKAAVAAVGAGGEDARPALLQLLVDLFGPDFFEPVIALINFNWAYPKRPTWGGLVAIGLDEKARVANRIINAGPGIAFAENIDTNESSDRQGLYRLELGFSLDPA